MNELILYKNESYKYYENKLLQRDNLKKEALEWQLEYNRTFGDILLKIFESKIECIRKKKIIAFYQMAINRGEAIDNNALQQYLMAEMAEYEKNLKEMLKANDDLKKSKKISEYEIQQIKRIYHRIAKKIHPDINPSLANNRSITNLWQRVTEAYELNHLKELEELEILVNNVLADENINVEAPFIVDIEKRIKEVMDEIERIQNTDPYLYRNLLEDDELVEQKLAEFQTNLDYYKTYESDLEAIIRDMLTSGDIILCQTN